jgi:hypothetical protein
MNNILSLPGTIYKSGMNIILFNKKNIIISKTFEKEKIREDFEVMCGNIEDFYSITSTERDNIFIIRDGKNYYPIVEVIKNDEDEKNFILNKKFKYTNDKKNIINHIAEFYQKNCKGSFLDSIINRDSLPSAREVLFYLTNINDKKYGIKYQVIDTRNKCKFFVTENNFLIPVRPSGSIYNIQIVKTIDKYINSFKDTYDELNKIYELTKKSLDVKPNAVYYDSKENETIDVNAIVTRSLDVIPVTNIKMKISEIEKLGLKYENMPLIDKIDNDIIRRKTNIKVDERVESVNKDMYYNESYELFRLEFSNYLNRYENHTLKNKIIKIIDNKKYTINDKTENIRLILYRLVDKKLYDKYKKIIESKNIQVDQETEIEVDENAAIEDEDISQKGGKYDKLVHLTNNEPELKTYTVNNDRESCNIHKNKEECNFNIHCHWTRTGCYMSLTKKMVIKFINKISDELAIYDRKAFEILKIDDYYVSDIVDYSKFTTRDNQKIIRSTGSNIKKELSNIFGTENIPIIGKRKVKTLVEFNYQQLNQEFPLTDMKEYYLQRIIQNNLTIFRAYVNGYYWINNKYNDPDTKNLGYYSPLQTELSNYFRGTVIEWMQNKKNESKLKDISKFMNLKKGKTVQDYSIKIGENSSFRTTTIPELYILSIINDIPIIVYDEVNTVLFIYDNGLKYNKYDNTYSMKESEINKYSDKTNRHKYINIRFIYITGEIIPDFIENIYYK